MKINKKIIIIVAALMLLSLGGISFAWFFTGDEEENVVTFSSGCLDITLYDESNNIDIEEAYPISDVAGIETEGYTFKIKNNCQTTTYYAIDLENIKTDAQIGSEHIRVALSGDKFDNIITTLSENERTTNYLKNTYEAFKLYTGTINGNESLGFKLRIWVDHQTTKEDQNKIYKSKINVLANPEFVDPQNNEIKTELIDGNMVGTITKPASQVRYCFTTDQECDPYDIAQIEDNQITVAWPKVKASQIMCNKINNTDVVYCSEAYKDIEPPTKPNIRLQDGTLYFEDSVDDQSEVTYHYSLGCNDSYTEGDRVTIDYSSRVCVYAQDETGNQSEVVEKTLNVIASQTKDEEIKYLCEDGSYVSDTNGCVRITQTTKTESYTYACSGYKPGSSEWVQSGPDVVYDSCSTTSQFDCNSSTNGTSYYVCEYIPWTCVSPRCSLGTLIPGMNSCEGLVYDSNASGSTCLSICLNNGWGGYGGFTKGVSCDCRKAADCMNDGMPSGSRKTTYTCKYTAAVNGSYNSPSKSGSDSCSTGTQCSVTPTNCPSTGGSCTSSRSCSGSCTGNCATNYTGETKYYCSLTNNYLDNQETAKNECTNYCQAGSLYNNKCYELV